MNHDSLIIRSEWIPNTKIVLGDTFNECLECVFFNILNKVDIICIDSFFSGTDNKEYHKIIANSNYKFSLNKIAQNKSSQSDKKVINKTVKKINKTILKNYIKDLENYTNYNYIHIYGLWENNFICFSINTSIPYYGDKINKRDSFKRYEYNVKNKPDIYSDKIAMFVKVVNII